jgi:hypothetical protein
VIGPQESRLIVAPAASNAAALALTAEFTNTIYFDGNAIAGLLIVLGVDPVQAARARPARHDGRAASGRRGGSGDLGPITHM